MTTLIQLAAVSGEGLVRNLLFLLIIVICVAAIYFVGRWFLAKLANATALMVWDGFFLLVGLIVVLNFLLSLIGRQFIVW
jgi:hypothetical protein